MFYSPLKNSLFRTAWIALFFSNIGTFVQTVTTAVFITTFTHSSVLIALVQTAAWMPIFLFAILGGIVADVCDRRRIIVFSQLAMASVAFGMAMLSHEKLMNAYLLIAMTFLLNVGFAFNEPAWQAISSTFVPVSEIKHAAAIKSLGFNLARSLGPAIAGFYYARLGPSWLFFLNGLSFVGVIYVFWKKVPTDSSSHLKKSKEVFILHQVRDGFLEMAVFLKKFSVLKFLFLKESLFFFCGSAIWALLPYIVIVHDHRSSFDLGSLAASAAIGCIFSVLSIYYLRQKLTESQMTTLSFFLVSIPLALIGRVHLFSLLAVLMFLFGYSWSLSVAVYNGILQSDFPVSSRSRLIGMYILFWAGAQTLGGYVSSLLVRYFGLVHGMTIIASVAFLIFVIYLMASIFLAQQKQHA